MMTPPPAILRHAVLFLSAVAVLSGLGFAVVAMRGEYYFMLASEILIVIAGVFGVLAGRGFFATGPALAAACVGGSILTAAGVGGLETTVLPSFRGGERIEQIAVFSRVGIAGLLGAAAGLMILARTPGRSMKYLVTGGLVGSPVLVLGIAWRLGLLGKLKDGVPEVVFQIGTLVIGMVVIILVSISAHCVIRAFEVGVDAAEETSGNTAS